jgi:hypothetical protein
VPPDAGPEIVIAAPGDGLTVGVSQQLAVSGCVALLGVVQQMCHEGGGDRLPAHGFALFPQEDQALIRVEILRTQCEGAAAAARGLGVQPQQQGVEDDVIARGACGVGDRPSSCGVNTRRMEGSRRGLLTRCAWLSLGSMRPSAMARL